MKPITPREVVMMIDRMFDDAPKREQEAWERRQPTQFEKVGAPDFENAVAALHDMIERIPPALITTRAEDFLAAKAAISQILGVWQQRRDAVLLRIRGFDPLHPVTLIRRCLVECPDAVPAEATPFLLFLDDDRLQEALRLDVSSAFESFGNQQWKATCVLAASVIEALLHWSVQGRDDEFASAAANAQRRLA